MTKPNYTLRLTKVTEKTCLLCNGTLDAEERVMKLDATIKVGFVPLPLSGEIHLECSETFGKKTLSLVAEARKGEAS